MELAIQHQQVDCLLMEEYRWFRLWAEVFEIDPNCRLSKQENTLQIRFSYQNRTFRGRTNSKNDFLLMQLPDQKWVYDLKTPLHIWLDKHL